MRSLSRDQGAPAYPRPAQQGTTIGLGMSSTCIRACTKDILESSVLPWDVR